MEKSSAPFSFGDGTIWNVILIWSMNAPFSNEPITMVYQFTRSIAIGSFKKRALLLIKITFQTVSPLNKNGEELFSMIAHWKHDQN